jgi:hypothetical protein
MKRGTLFVTACRINGLYGGHSNRAGRLKGQDMTPET